MNRISPKISTLHRNNRAKISVSDAHSQATNTAGSLAGQMEREIFFLHNHRNRKSQMAVHSQAH